MGKKRYRLLIFVSLFLGLILFSSTSFAAEGKEKLTKGIEQRVESLETLFANLKESVSGQAEEISKLKDSNSNNNMDIEELSKTVVSQSNEVFELKKTVEDQNKLIGELTEKVSALMAEVEGLKGQEGGSEELPDNNFVVKGKVTKEDGTPVSWAKIRLMDDGGYYGASTDENGNYQINVREAGTYPIIVSEQGYFIGVEKEVVVSANLPVIFDLVLVEGGTIEGKIDYADGISVGYVSIKVLDGNGALINRINVNASGSYKINAPEGTYTLLLEASEGRSKTEIVTVKRAQTITQNFFLAE